MPSWAVVMLKTLKGVCEQLTFNHDMMKNNYDELKKENESLKLIIDAQEQYSRRNCILIHGIAETQDEDTDTPALDVINNQLDIPDTSVNKRSFDRTHRIGRKKVPNANDRSRRSTNRPIISQVWFVQRP